VGASAEPSLDRRQQDLHGFLFGTERSNLGTVREVLQALQTSCFYCRRSFRTLPVSPSHIL
jgi:hypothetical protein